MKFKQIGEGERVWVVVFDKDDEVIETLKHFAREQGLKASHFTAIGALERAVLGYFDWESKTYKQNAVHEQVEVLMLSGFITESNQGPKIHCHVALGRSDGSALGGHLLEGWVRPTLELVVTESPHALRRKLDHDTGLPLIDLDASP